MSTQANTGFGALTEKEKQTLRLIVRGHDAKSTARSLGLSVHTINERLRDARRKMAVSSSREAARLLLEAESSVVGDPESFGDVEIRADATLAQEDQDCAPTHGVRRASRRPWIIGAFGMTFALGLFALAALPHIASNPASPSVASQENPNLEVVESARQWLTLVDEANWDESYRASGAPFRTLNTAEVWAAASKRVRAPLGALLSRTFVSQENLPAPPDGYEVVKFRTTFANKVDALETVTLDREDGHWRVVGVTIG